MIAEHCKKVSHDLVEINIGQSLAELRVRQVRRNCEKYACSMTKVPKKVLFANAKRRWNAIRAFQKNPGCSIVELLL